MKWSGEGDAIIGYAAAAVLTNDEPRHLVVDDEFLPVHPTAEAALASGDCATLAQIIDQNGLTAAWLNVHPVSR